jgi:uroporphyrinogen decarboxylase
MKPIRFDAIKLTKEMLDDEVPLIALLVHLGQLCATRWKDKDLKVLIAKGFCFSHPEAAHVLLQKITDTTILYLQEK